MTNSVKAVLFAIATLILVAACAVVHVANAAEVVYADGTRVYVPDTVYVQQQQPVYVQPAQPIYIPPTPPVVIEHPSIYEELVPEFVFALVWHESCRCQIRERIRNPEFRGPRVIYHR